MSEETKSDLSNDIKNVLEFYFGNSNWRKDTFLRNQAKENNDYVPIDILLKCNRLAKLTSDSNEVVESAKQSTKLLVNETNDGIKRSEPLPDKDDTPERSVFIDGFPKDGEEGAETVTISAVRDLFLPFGPVSYVRIRRDKSRKLLGSVIIEFETLEGANACVEGKDSLSFNGKKLSLVLPLLEWVEEMKNLKKRKREEKEQSDREEFKKKWIPGVLFSMQRPTYLSELDIKNELKEKFGRCGWVERIEGRDTLYIRMGDEESGQNLEDGLVKKDDSEDETKKYLKFEDQFYEVQKVTGEEEEEFYQRMQEETRNGHKKRKRYRR